MKRGLSDSAVVRMEERKLGPFWWKYGGHVMSPGALAGICGVPRPTIYEWCHTGKVRAWTTKRGEFYVHIGECIRHALSLGNNVMKDWVKWLDTDGQSV